MSSTGVAYSAMRVLCACYAMSAGIASTRLTCPGLLSVTWYRNSPDQYQTSHSMVGYQYRTPHGRCVSTTLHTAR
eukprot:3259582-Rhodomonas_salina.2